MFQRKVNYIKEALTEPINIWSMVGFASTAAYMQSWIPLAAGVATEAIYLVTVPAHSAYRRLVDRREHALRGEQVQIRRAVHVGQIGLRDVTEPSNLALDAQRLGEGPQVLQCRPAAGDDVHQRCPLFCWQ